MEAFWSACKLQNNRERLALAELARAGFETYCPRVQKRRFSKGKKIITHPLLFPNYIFVLNYFAVAHCSPNTGNDRSDHEW